MKIKYIKNDLVLYKYSNTIYVSGYLGSLKFKLNDIYWLELTDNILFLKNKILSVNSGKKTTTRNYAVILSKISNSLINVLYGSINKFKIVGLGYKLLFSNNQWVFKLGYSHLLYNNLSLKIYTKKKKKKRKYISVGSMNKCKLNLFLKSVENYRVPNKYSANGIFNRLTNIKLKKKKIQF